MSKYLSTLNATSDERAKASNELANEQAIFAAEGAISTTKSKLATTRAAIAASYAKNPFPLDTIIALKEEEAVLSKRIETVEAILNSDLK